MLDYRERDIVREHRKPMEAVIGQDTALALRRLTDHYDLTWRIIEQDIEEPEVEMSEKPGQ